ncbi:MAG TPA: hypothetical protein DEG17_03385 [Cyanobacteria bacterium UBA11149]|nr:hypothetical protein [Cyanobacteria bacterium UBA11367]HBE61064.1 hypothetical protein [Cyanobacteria bacterium UBA11366]HBK62273.1 hypothetical protein [Cyanobacteria bacterium UBA11166]HBR74249.1 hypothetical protein [Cyanobacteria bacterium UBA11159]HBS69854.1 hypothetical protein [Cyanobacteria bacterium UBA11153]HBW87950.1 hypothetical protein [Cyanobacteria bacterium UBA11149]HCA95018.1 hypothetical protein [Cyanobacteria bacterium UBA9226]
MDTYFQTLLALGNKFLDADARKFQELKDDLFMEVSVEIEKKLALSAETQESLKAFLDRLGNAVGMPDLEVEVEG